MLGFGISPTQRIRRSEITPDQQSTPAHRNSTGGKESRMEGENKKKEWVEEGIMAWSRISSDILFIDFFLSKALE